MAAASCFSFIARFGLIALFSPLVWADYHLNMHSGVTPISKAIYHLHMTIFGICVVIAIAVFSVMFYAIIWHRKSRGIVATQFHENIIVEIIWTIIPFMILVAMAIPAVKVLIRMDDTRDSELSIKITGYQWYWEYEYLGKNVRFFSRLATTPEQINNQDMKGEHYLLEVDRHLVVPIGKKIRFLTTANDVIHSWWVPKLGVKKDAIPGFINETWAEIEEPGIYRGQCAELCGYNHGFMPIVVEALPATEFESWLSQQQTPPVSP